MSKFSITVITVAIIGLLLAVLKPDYHNYKLWLPSNFLSNSDLCETPSYDVRFVSWDPVVLHVENFITSNERRALIKQAKSLLRVSDVVHPNGTRTLSEHRRSSTALLEAPGFAARCVRRRIASFQGFVDDQNVEPLQVTWYDGGGYFRLHHDHNPNSTNADETRSKRATTGFIILAADCEDCGTQFPLLRTQFTHGDDDPWCRVLDCRHNSLTIKPLPGSMLFWLNKNTTGDVDSRMLHQGLPLLNNSMKIGLNVWTSLDFGAQVVRRSHVS